MSMKPVSEMSDTDFNEACRRRAWLKKLPLQRQRRPTLPPRPAAEMSAQELAEAIRRRLWRKR